MTTDRTADPAFDDELTQHVFEITYRRMVDDCASYAGLALAAHGTHGRGSTRRFYSRDAVESTRRAIASACTAADAEPALAEFLTTRWLDAFAPRPM